MANVFLGTPNFQSGLTSPLFVIPGLSYLGASKSYNPQNGTRWVLVFEGTPAACERAYLLVPTNYSKELDATRGAAYRLIVTTPDDPTSSVSTAISTTYELLGNTSSVSLWVHVKSLALSAAQRELVKTAVRTRSTTGLSGDALSLAKLIIENDGSRSFYASQYVFRMTQVVASTYQQQVSFANVGKVYTATQMQAEANPPATLFFSISAVSSRTAVTSPEGYLYGWLKQTPTINQIANYKFSVTNEWWLDDWSTWIYSAV